MKLEQIGSLLPKQLGRRGSLIFFAGVLGVFLLIAGGLPFTGKGERTDSSDVCSAAQQRSEVYVRQLEERLAAAGIQAQVKIAPGSSRRFPK